MFNDVRLLMGAILSCLQKQNKVSVVKKPHAEKQNGQNMGWVELRNNPWRIGFVFM